MRSTQEAISDQAIVLPPDQRLNLARALIESVDGTEDCSPEAAWDLEISARLESYLSGAAQSVPAADVFRRLREMAPGW
jgi:putative addiction module component (TIGR02574 family)